jgi:TRAP-type C4-dicarboxylate transport system permease small subunit
MVVFFMAIALIFTMGQAVDRYGLDSTFNSYDQISQLALVWLTFVGNMLAIRDNANIRVDLIDASLSNRLLRLRNIVSDIAIIGLFGIIQVKIWRLVELGAGQPIVGTPFSSDATYLALAVGSALGIVVVGVRLILDLARRTSPQC